eukprot:CAMPEP_0197825830 /NCGR_PEP_ID=MMETSP1437-20131217/2864_1 /TAXON_ID=49252 ORGANISM="Eucampia antarctica, Strain CCMP1452" /NCGR_SAMPLE_ID=MMETSP1437 /ASSEMBLY_ACC=CAM_ASM_001096 /LENGTH=189 /DNA_ID=CAMNT_0043425999 /DNA_START=159 /DNA_END=725 /DNA_ORIENTATION=+
MPPLCTYVARVSDGLPLVASFSPSSANLEEEKNQAKQILRKLTTGPTSRMSIDTGRNFCFHYVIRDNLCFLTLTETSYPKRLAFLYLEEVAHALWEELLNQNTQNPRAVIDSISRPYALIQYDTLLAKYQRDFADPTTKQNSSKLSQDLSDITSIMKQNIEQVLDRGEKLEHVSKISSNLVSESKKFTW